MTAAEPPREDIGRSVQDYIDERPVWAESRGREERCAYYEITRTEHAARRA